MVVKKTRGLFAGRKLAKRRKKVRFAKKFSRSKRLKIYKKFDPLEGCPQARGIVLQKVNRECKQPHSGLKKCAVIQIIKNGRPITAFLPGNLALKFVDEHDEVIVERIGGPQRGAKGDIPGIKFKVVKVKGQSLNQLVRGKKEKIVR